MIIGNDPRGHAVKIDLDRLIVTKMLVQANSGAGKSFTLRRILEQTYGKIQQIVIDVEDEFYTLREKYDYVLAGRTGGDCPADVRSASLLARRLLELGVSAIVGIYELKPKDRIQFVKLFLESFVSVPRSLWHPCLIVLDEAQMFAPEKGEGEADSLEAVINLSSLGRKRAFCPILATQRISKLHKSAAAELNNKLIGRSALDVDMKRAARELGFSSREDELSLRDLEDGEFYAFGPAISKVVTRVKVGPVETTHPKAGQQAAPPPPPRDRVQKVLAQLADLPKEAEAEQAGRVELQRRVRELEGELRRAASATQVSAPAKIDPDRLKREFDRGASSVKSELATELRLCAKTAASIQPATLAALRDVAQAITRAMSHIEQVQIPVMPSLEAIIDQVKAAPLASHIPASNIPPRAMAAAAPGASPARVIVPRAPREPVDSNGSLPPGERKILTAAAQYPEGVTREQLSLLADLARSTRDRYVQYLAQKGLVEVTERGIKATDEGYAALGPDFTPLPTGDALRAYWLRKLPVGEQRILEVLASHYPQAVEREAIDEATGLARSTRDRYLQYLAARKIITVSKEGPRASDELFG